MPTIINTENLGQGFLSSHQGFIVDEVTKSHHSEIRKTQKHFGHWIKRKVIKRLCRRYDQIRETIKFKQSHSIGRLDDTGIVFYNERVRFTLCGFSSSMSPNHGGGNALIELITENHQKS